MAHLLPHVAKVCRWVENSLERCFLSLIKQLKHLVFVSNTISEIKLEEGAGMIISSTGNGSHYERNAYMLWEIRSPDNFVISIDCEHFHMNPDHGNLFFGDGVDEFSLTETSCHPWTRLSNQTTKLTTKSSLLKLIFTSDQEEPGSAFRLYLNTFSSARNFTNTSGKPLNDTITHAVHFNASLIYTERQKKLITSSEQHSLSTSSKLIICGHRLGIVILKHIKKQRFAWVKD